ncbi:ATP-binding protein [Winogradskya humida]|uniref:AAA domain-containing protein n=1 Tax=Winogradskya humida TaxID=113566 RepID=A0ABQ3ZZ52_9ACTN|nr:ATP-binding protein [Actinoplanes humidus]GIE23851.1 hypothetical protein Ahu01nite_069530 [Actinoplanes humidus]
MSGEELATRVAVATGLAVPAVERVFRDQGFGPALTDSLPRSVQLRRLRIAGDRSVEPRGLFDRDIVFGPGLTVLAADNLRGKTSVLELITWCLRGSPRGNLQGVVRSWLSRLDCDAVIGGRPLGFRLSIRDGELVEGRVLSGPDPERLARADTAQPGEIVEIVHATTPATFADRVEKLMMELLHLEELESSSSRAAAGRATYGWPAYYGALYLPPGGDPALLGDTVMGGIAGRLLQVFLDLPGAALLTRLRTARDQMEEAARAADSDAARTRRLMETQRNAVLVQLGSARTEMAQLRKPPQAAALLDEVSTRTGKAVAAEASLREARETCEALRWQRQQDEKLLNDLLEEHSAGLFFHGLDPAACPRCEHPIRPERRAAEREHGICAVCAEPVDAGEPDRDDVGMAEEEARWRLKASRQAEELASAHREETAAYAADRRAALAEAEHDLATLRDGGYERRRAELRDLVARLEGAASAWDALPGPPDRRRDDVRVVLDAAVELLAGDQAAAGEELFDELNTDIAALARTFGFRNLDRVAVDRSGRIQVYKTGGPQEWFKNQSPGERLRLRIAVVVALLRRGQRRGVATHPGLLLIDSPRSEEVQDDDAAALLTALEQLCAGTRGLQILVTTVDEPLVRRALTGSTIITAPGPGEPLW